MQETFQQSPCTWWSVLFVRHLCLTPMNSVSKHWCQLPLLTSRWSGERHNSLLQPWVAPGRVSLSGCWEAEVSLKQGLSRNTARSTDSSKGREESKAAALKNKTPSTQVCICICTCVCRHCRHRTVHCSCFIKALGQLSCCLEQTEKWNWPKFSTADLYWILYLWKLQRCICNSSFLSTSFLQWAITRGD